MALAAATHSITPLSVLVRECVASLAHDVPELLDRPGPGHTERTATPGQGCEPTAAKGARRP